MTFFKKYKVALGLVFVGLALVLAMEAKSMFTACVFSEVKGQVVSAGKPVADAILVRSYDWHWGNQQGRDETRTDANGEFSFPPIKKAMILGSLLPHEPYIEQLILIKIGDKIYRAWGADKRDYALRGKLVEFDNGRRKYYPMNLHCDIQIEPKSHKRGSYSEYYGIAKLHYAKK